MPQTLSNKIIGSGQYGWRCRTLHIRPLLAACFLALSSLFASLPAAARGVPRCAVHHPVIDDAHAPRKLPRVRRETKMIYLDYVIKMALNEANSAIAAAPLHPHLHNGAMYHTMYHTMLTSASCDVRARAFWSLAARNSLN